MSKLETIITTCGTLDIGAKLIGERLIAEKTGKGREHVRCCHHALFARGIISQAPGCFKVILKDVYTGEDHY